ncbi:hypothetical protein [Leifsonia sp. TF02-11]|uniref:hypothetical protein n=1 Tax=Leifsonia sp. TF02-11 TaxID=2815212 RepID=UPI001AA0E6A2|nr:hypothetical protein [Leifsonia sp. TF02-11]MBO1737787.1 hypothetical protein [Leifsonia sp. TF02-11]
MTLIAAPTGSPAWPADWSQFVPDLLSSAIIGLAIGIFLYLWQRTAEQRQARSFAKASWSVARSRVVVAVAKEVMTPPWLSHTMDDPFAELWAALDGLPVAQWQAAAPDLEELRLASEIATKLPLLHAAGRKLLSDVNVALMRDDWGRLMSPDRADYQDEVLRRLRDGVESEGFANTMMQALGFLTEEKSADIAAKAKAAAEQEALQKSYGNYLGLFSEIRASYMKLRSLMHVDAEQSGSTDAPSGSS